LGPFFFSQKAIFSYHTSGFPRRHQVTRVERALFRRFLWEAPFFPFKESAAFSVASPSRVFLDHIGQNIGFFFLLLINGKVQPFNGLLFLVVPSTRAAPSNFTQITYCCQTPSPSLFLFKKNTFYALTRLFVPAWPDRSLFPLFFFPFLESRYPPLRLFPSPCATKCWTGGLLEGVTTHLPWALSSFSHLVAQWLSFLFPSSDRF